MAVVVGLLLSGGVLAFAAPSSVVGVSESIRIYEDDFVTFAGGDNKLFTGSVTNLFNFVHTPVGICATGDIKLDDNWNDCVGAVKYTLGPTRCIALYRDSHYRVSSRFMTLWGASSTIDELVETLGPNRDAMTSFKFYTKSPATPAGNC